MKFAPKFVWGLRNLGHLMLRSVENGQPPRGHALRGPNLRGGDGRQCRLPAPPGGVFFRSVPHGVTRVGLLLPDVCKHRDYALTFFPRCVEKISSGRQVSPVTPCRRPQCTLHMAAPTTAAIQDSNLLISIS